MANLPTNENTPHFDSNAVRAFQEMNVLYDVSAAMRTTLELDHILHIILTGVTSHSGLGYNRALLFLLNETTRMLECKMALGPESGEHAHQVWNYIKASNPKLEDLIKAEKLSQAMTQSSLFKSMKRLKIPVTATEESLLKTAFERGAPWHLKGDQTEKYKTDRLLEIFPTNELVIMPLNVKDKTIGLIVADNIFTQKPISDEDLRMFAMLANHAALAIENSRLYEMVRLRSQKDFLTDLWNHGYFQTKLAEETLSAQKNKTTLSLAMIDIDNFKSLNDSNGHQRGDRVLKQLGEIFKSLSRETDFVCRYGGEEFTVILSQTSRDQAFEIAERLRRHIEGYAFAPPQSAAPGMPPGPVLHLTVSIGLATYPEDAGGKEELIGLADKAMYVAKFSGKNRTCFSKG